MAMADADNARPRGDRGRWRRSLAVAERDAEAARLASMGWSYSKIASELGYSDAGNAHRGARRAMAELAEAHGAGELRRQQIESNKLLRERMWQIVNDPPPMVSRIGKVVVDEATGEQIPDAQAVIGAAATILKADERIARLAGLDAPRRSLTATMSLDQHIEELREAYRREKGYDPLAPEVKAAYEDWLAGEAPLELGGKVMMPKLSDLPADEREGLLEQIRETERGVAAGYLVRTRRAIPGQVVTDDT
jgi:hypothetical protein